MSPRVLRFKWLSTASSTPGRIIIIIIHRVSRAVDAKVLPTRSTLGTRLRGNNLHQSALTLQIRHHRLDCGAPLSSKTVEGFKYASGVWKSQAVGVFLKREREKKNMRMISDAAVKFKFCSVSLWERCQRREREKKETNPFNHDCKENKLNLWKIADYLLLCEKPKKKKGGCSKKTWRICSWKCNYRNVNMFSMAFFFFFFSHYKCKCGFTTQRCLLLGVWPVIWKENMVGAGQSQESSTSLLSTEKWRSPKEEKAVRPSVVPKNTRFTAQRETRTEDLRVYIGAQS